MDSVWRSVRTGARAGVVVAVVYFVILSVLTAFGAVATGATVNLLGLVLFVGAGVACGLVLGILAGLSVGVALGRLLRRPDVAASRLRLVCGAAAGLPVLLLTVVEQVSGAVGVLEPDVTTVVVLPTLVATAIGAGSADGLAAAARRPGRGQPKRPET